VYGRSERAGLLVYLKPSTIIVLAMTTERRITGSRKTWDLIAKEELEREGTTECPGKL